MSKQVMIPVRWSLPCVAAACDADRFNRTTPLSLNGTRAQVTAEAKRLGWYYHGKGAWWCPKHAREGGKR